MESYRPSASMSEADLAFTRARAKAFLRQVWATLNGEPNQLLNYDDVRAKVRAGYPIYRGIQAVPIKQIVGSVSRYRDFDRAFLPSQNFTKHRWRRVGSAYMQDISLPPVQLYKVGDVYFVIDGNHRVSVAREMGMEFIEAEIQEAQVRVPISADMAPDKLDAIGEKIDFLERTALDQSRPNVDIELSLPGGYYRLLEHIEVHRYLQSTEWKREFTFEEAAAQWVDQVYLPLVETIRENEVLKEFTDRTEADLYLWIIEHQHYLRERFDDVSNADAARDYAEHFSPNPWKRLWRWVRDQFTAQP
ncbi:MAG: DUF4032 domain-containing protein [Chloroflexi bacterium]|nr:DUF4032 domain-containing protein [Chloroflexota bacterium]